MQYSIKWPFNSIRMKKNILLFLCLLLSMNSEAQKLPDDAHQLYQDFSAAVKENSIEGIQAVMTKGSFISIKNDALSFGIVYPGDVIDQLSLSMLDFKYFKYMTYKTNGPTSNAYYLYTEGNSESIIITLCMELENGKYKLDGLKMRDAKDFMINLNNKDYSFLDLAEFRPSGVVKPMPPIIEKVDYIANIDITCYGYTVSVTVNGIFQETVQNKSRSGVLMGGVKKGENIVELSIEKTDVAETALPEIGIRALINQQEKQVFYMNEDLVGTSIKKTFTVQ